MDVGFRELLHPLKQSLQESKSNAKNVMISQNRFLIHFGKSFHHLIVFQN
jgi:hypothetical protein